MVFSFTFKNNSVFIERFYGGNNILGDLLKSEVVNSKMILSFIFLNLILASYLPALFLSILGNVFDCYFEPLLNVPPMSRWCKVRFERDAEWILNGVSLNL